LSTHTEIPWTYDIPFWLDNNHSDNYKIDLISGNFITVFT